jgi:hypothetical protein
LHNKIIFCGSTPRKAEGNRSSVKAAVLLNTIKKPSKREDKNTRNVRMKIYVLNIMSVFLP